jgi:hypothetical protein
MDVPCFPNRRRCRPVQRWSGSASTSASCQSPHLQPAAHRGPTASLGRRNQTQVHTESAHYCLLQNCLLPRHFHLGPRNSGLALSVMCTTRTRSTHGPSNKELIISRAQKEKPETKKKKNKAGEKDAFGLFSWSKIWVRLL